MSLLLVWEEEEPVTQDCRALCHLLVTTDGLCHAMVRSVCSYARMWCYVVVPYIDVILAVCTYGTIYMHMRAVIGLAEVRLSHYGSLRNPSDVTNEASRRPRVAGCSARCPAVLLTRFSWRVEGPMARLGCEWRLGLLLPRPSGHGGRPFFRGVGVSAGTAVEQAPV